VTIIKSSLQLRDSDGSGGGVIPKFDKLRETEHGGGEHAQDVRPHVERLTGHTTLRLMMRSSQAASLIERLAVYLEASQLRQLGWEGGEPVVLEREGGQGRSLPDQGRQHAQLRVLQAQDAQIAQAPVLLLMMIMLVKLRLTITRLPRLWTQVGQAGSESNVGRKREGLELGHVHDGGRQSLESVVVQRQEREVAQSPDLWFG
jgi:hypothetical protein